MRGSYIHCGTPPADAEVSGCSVTPNGDGEERIACYYLAGCGGPPARTHEQRVAAMHAIAESERAQRHAEIVASRHAGAPPPSAFRAATAQEIETINATIETDGWAGTVVLFGISRNSLTALRRGQQVRLDVHERVRFALETRARSAACKATSPRRWISAGSLVTQTSNGKRTQ